jgi:hypothetical protein
MFNRDVELALRKSLLFLVLMLAYRCRSRGERECFLLLMRDGANFTNPHELETKRIDSNLIRFVTIRVIHVASAVKKGAEVAAGESRRYNLLFREEP